MTAQHTTGPWKTLPEEAGKAYIRVRGTRLGATYKIANVLVHTYPGALDIELNEARANASLIAAAPDLIDALKDLAQSIVWKEFGECRGFTKGMPLPIITAVEKARAAIAKAGGAA